MQGLSSFAVWFQSMTGASLQTASQTIAIL